jgi:hypothetical protein
MSFDFVQLQTNSQPQTGIKRGRPPRTAIERQVAQATARYITRQAQQAAPSSVFIIVTMSRNHDV